MPQPYSNFKDSNAALTSAGTRQQLAGPTPCGKVTITAGENNAGNIVIGGPTVVGAIIGRSGSALPPLNSITLEIDDLSKVWFDGTNTGDTVSYSYLL
jgi:hypothetical protein